MTRLSAGLVAAILSVSFLGCSSSTSTSAAGGNGGGGSGGSGGEAGASSCTTTDGCAADEYCDFPDDRCGDGEAGVCEKRGEACSDGALIICSCDGKAEYAGCQTLNGFDQNIDATTCTDLSAPLEEVFACGDRFCRTGVSYCQRAVSDVSDEPDVYSCEFLPSACPDTGATCACLTGEPCGSICDDAGAGAVTLTCPGG